MKYPKPHSIYLRGTIFYFRVQVGPWLVATSFVACSARGAIFKRFVLVVVWLSFILKGNSIPKPLNP